MNDKTKTIAFLGAAGLAIGLALLTRPVEVEQSQGIKQGEFLLGTDFSPTKVAGMEIVTWQKGVKKAIKIKQSDSGWFIHRDNFQYPADADNQLGPVATSLAALKVHRQETDKQGDHAKFGVLDPSIPDETQKAEGEEGKIGKLLTLMDRGSKSLAKLILGNKTEDENSAYRYVRIPGDSTVYSVQFSDHIYDKATTQFAQWVEKDFLDLDHNEVKRIHLDNYKIVQTMVQVPNMPQGFQMAQPEQQPGTKHTFVYTDGNWTSPNVKLAETESLNQEILDEMKESFDDLEIIDVEKKPAGKIKELLAKLWKSQNEKNQQAFQTHRNKLAEIGNSMGAKGFHLQVTQTVAGLQESIFSDDGEIKVGMKDGVEYVLRFGKIYRGQDAVEDTKARFLLAQAQVNDALLGPLDLEPVPSPLPSQPAPQPVDNNGSTPPPPPPGNQGPEGKKGPGENKDALPTAPPPAPDANATKAYQQAVAKRNGEIAAAEGRNDQKQSARAKTIKEAREKAEKLNKRLSQWYYVISDEAYAKIHLQRSQFVTPKSTTTVAARPDKVKASHVLVAYKGASRANPSITRSKEEAKARAETLRKQIVEEGKDFATVARKNSDGPSKTKGGDLGSFTFQTMAKPFSEAAFALEVGAVSEVVETDFGFHVIKRTE